MFERFTPAARTVVVCAQEHARRLGHRYIGCEHLLHALVSTGQAASVVLREHGVTPERVEEEIVRRAGLGAGAVLFADLDRDALASIGIDLDAVRARIEASFGPEAVTRADQAIHGGPRPFRLAPAVQCPPPSCAAGAAPGVPSLRHRPAPSLWHRSPLPRVSTRIPAPALPPK
ncbi:MAG TPA: Clp protease N-terminal domain-containing protein [Streptosporangiaceae bacterium]|nr:Clp protease N-terminal domain-containing protein [Streptosporangiaceae bacterium]